MERPESRTIDGYRDSLIYPLDPLLNVVTL